MTASKACLRRSSIISVLILAFLPLVQSECQPSCLVCNINNYCTQCREGYYKIPRVPGSDEGSCVPCIPGCNLCKDSAECDECKPGYAQFSFDCPACSKGCAACEYEASNCTSCLDNYTHDKHNFCYFKFIPHIIIGTILGLFMLILLAKLICVFIERRRNRITFYPDSVLDSESRVNTYFVQDAKLIGVADSGDRDLSKVQYSDQDQPEKFIHDNTAMDVLGLKRSHLANKSLNQSLLATASQSNPNFSKQNK